MPERNGFSRILSLYFKVVKIVVNPVIEPELPLLHLLEQGKHGHSLKCGANEIDSAGNCRSAGPQIGVTESAGPNDAIFVDKSNSS